MTTTKAMTRGAALKAAEKLFGRTAAIVYNPKGLKAADRDAAVEASRELRARGEKVPTELLVQMGSYRYRIGRNLGWCFVVEGQGDSWAEAIADAKRRRSKSAAGV